MPKRIGRPMVRRDPAERVPLATRIRGELFNKLIDAAVAHGDRSLGSEVEMRLELSFDPLLPAEYRELMMLLGSAYRHGGITAVITVLLTTVDNPDEDEQLRRWHRAWSTLQRLHPDFPPSGFVPRAPGEPAPAVELYEDEAGNLFDKATGNQVWPKPIQPPA